MRLYPTRSTFQVALAGATMVAVGVAAKLPPVVAFGGAMILAVVLGRALALTTVTRIRASGFEMVWSTNARVTNLGRGGTVVLEAELRNRGGDDARGVNVRPVASSMLGVKVVPETLDLPANSRVRFEMHVTANRVGRWGLHGIALEVRGTPLGGEGLYEVPLMFANPHGVEVLPEPLAVMLTSARGGRSRRLAVASGRPSTLAGEGEQFRELRERVAGDAFKRIAWKASARRGQLLVREMEREERDVVWLLLDASVELWAGPVGKAPLDLAIDAVAGMAERHLAKGDRVGLAVFASRIRSFVPPDKGPIDATRIASALASAASMVDADRCELDEPELAARVAEHLRPLDPRGLTDVPRGNLDALAARAESLRLRAPFAPRIPQAASPREERFRHYLASFGIEVPPRADGEREKADVELGRLLEELAKNKKVRPSIVHVWAPAPTGRGTAVEHAVRRLKKAHVDVRWTVPVFDQSVEPEPAEGARTLDEAVRQAVTLRVDAAGARGIRTLRGLGVRPRVLGRANHARAMLPKPTDER